MRDRWLIEEEGAAVLRFPSTYTYEELDAEFTAVVADFKAIASRGRRVVVVVDLYDVESSNARNRARIAAAMKEVATADHPILAQIYVIRRAPLRAALTAIHWLFPAPWPVHVVGTRDEARALARSLGSGVVR